MLRRHHRHRLLKAPCVALTASHKALTRLGLRFKDLDSFTSHHFPITLGGPRAAGRRSPDAVVASGNPIEKPSASQMAAHSDVFSRNYFAFCVKVSTWIGTLVSKMKWGKQFGSNIFPRAVTFVSNGLLNNAGPLQFVFSHLDLVPTSLRELHITNITNVAQ